MKTLGEMLPPKGERLNAIARQAELLGRTARADKLYEQAGKSLIADKPEGREEVEVALFRKTNGDKFLRVLLHSAKAWHSSKRAKVAAHLDIADFTGNVEKRVGFAAGMLCEYLEEKHGDDYILVDVVRQAVEAWRELKAEQGL